MTVVAKFNCVDVDRQHENQVSVHLTPVHHENNPDHPNYSFWQATPSGSLDMIITNISAAEYFVEGEVYTMTLVRELGPEPTEQTGAGDQA